MKDDKRLRRKVRNSYIVSTVSTALVLFLLGSVGYLMFAAMRVADALQESVQVMVELQRGIAPEERGDVERFLSEEEMVTEVAFSSREEKAADGDFRRMFASEYEEIVGENPLRDSFDVKLSAKSSDGEYLGAFVARLEAMPGVECVSYPEMLVERLHTTVDRIRFVLLVFGGALLVISLILLGNTIRLAIFSKRYLINTMKLVGATKWFIMRPFVGSALLQGLLAGAGASVLFCGAVYGLNEAVPELTSLAELEKIAIILCSMIFGGITLSVIFTVVSVNRFVNMKSNKIYLY